MARRPDLALVRRYALQHNRLRLAAGLAVGRAWDRLAGPDDARAGRFVRAAAVLSSSAQAQTVAQVDGYLALLLALDGEGSPLGLDPDQLSGAALRGVDPPDVYLRSIITARAALGDGKPFAEAMALGRLRAVGTIEMDVALTQRAAMAEVSTREERIVGYRRVLSGQSCAFCASASTQRYRSGDLMPIHNHCDCGVSPIIGDRDPGHIINDQLRRDLRSAEKHGEDYWNARHFTVDEDGSLVFPDVTVHQHGELGPVLGDATHDFAGPGVAA